MTGRRKTLETVRAEMEQRWLAVIVRQMNLRYQVAVCDREIVAIERRLEMLKETHQCPVASKHF
jgi:predicted lipid carrier protein YhbT